MKIAIVLIFSIIIFLISIILFICGFYNIIEEVPKNKFINNIYRFVHFKLYTLMILNPIIYGIMAIISFINIIVALAKIIF